MKALQFALIALLLTAPAVAQDVAPTLEALRASYPTPMTKAQLSDMLNRAASSRPGWGMLRKDSGNNCPTPYPGISISCDWMVYGPTRWGYDILSDQENRANVVRGDGEALGAGAEVVYPWPTEAPPVQPPVVVPPTAPIPPSGPPAIDLSSLAKYDQLERVYADLAARAQLLSTQLQALDVKLTRHDEEPMWVTKFLGNRYAQIVMTGLGVYGVQKVTK